MFLLIERQYKWQSQQLFTSDVDSLEETPKIERVHLPSMFFKGTLPVQIDCKHVELLQMMLE